jgi:acyl-CoA thioesterase-1
MQFTSDYKLPVIIIAIAVAVILFLVVEFLYLKFNGKPLPATTISREPRVIGAGAPLSYVVMGDSTAVGVGGTYEKGIAMSTTRHLAKDHQVTMTNLAISGARVADIEYGQLERAISLRPDIVLLAIGANDVVHLTPPDSVERGMNTIIDKIRDAHPSVKIVITGAPQMGSIPRFPLAMRFFAEYRTAQINTVMARVAQDKNVVFARIADRTGDIFKAHPEFFAIDKFHPTTEGYDTWLPVLYEALDAVH